MELPLLLIQWIDQIRRCSKQIQSTHIQHLVRENNLNNQIANKIEQMGLIKTKDNEQCLVMVVKIRKEDQEKVNFS